MSKTPAIRTPAPAQALVGRVASRLLTGITAIALLAPVSAVNAESAASGSLANMIEQALIARTESQIAAAGIDVARARLSRSNRAYRPQLDLTVSNDITSLYDPFTGVVATAVINGQPVSVDVTRSQPRSVLVANLRLSYPLYTGGRRQSEQAQARAGLGLAQSDATITASQITRDVTIAWFDVHRSNLDVLNAQSRLLLSAELARLQDGRAKRGLAARIDSESASTEVSVLNALILEKQANRRANWIRLARARGLSSVPAEPDWHLFTDTTVLGTSVAQLRPFIHSAAEPERQTQQVAAAQAQVRAAQSASRPQVSLFAQYNAAGRSDGTEWLPLDNIGRSDLVVGARLQWRLYDGGQTDAAVREQLAALEQQKLQRAQLQQQQEFAVAAAKQERVANQHRLARLSARLPLLRRQIEIARVKQRAGRADIRAVPRLLIEQAELSGEIRLAQLDLLLAHTRTLLARALPQ
jgi:outer membrane protein TolC